MRDFLLDTNHVTHLMAEDGELYFAVHASQRREQNLRALKEFMKDIVLWPFDEAAAEEFGRIQAEQKRKGRPIPPTDSQIAAVCRVRDLTVLTDDRHFRFVENLRVENWLWDPD